MKVWPIVWLGGGFKDFSFSPLAGEMIQFDVEFDGTEVPQYSWPATGPTAVRESLSFQLNRFWDPFKPSEFPQSYTSKLDAAEVLASGFPYAPYDQPLLVRNWLSKCARALEAEKSAAASRILGIDKKGQFVMSIDNQMRSLAVVAFLAVADHTWLDSMDPHQLLLCGALEPEEIFVKPEMHGRKKVESKRWRAIWHCSAQAELSTRLLHDIQNKTEISAYQCGLTHSKEFPTFGSPGMGRHDAGIQEVVEAIKRLRGPECAEIGTADASGWDTSVTRSLWICDGYRCALLGESAGLGRSHSWAQLNLSLILSAHVVSVDGYLYDVARFGIMSSGNPSTSASNSFMRQLVHALGFRVENEEITLANIKLSLTMGDDLMGQGRMSDAVIHSFKTRGALIDDAAIVEDLSSISFTSHLFSLDGTAVFDNGKKMLARLCFLNQKLTCEQAAGILFAVRHTPELKAQILELFDLVLDDYTRSNVASFADEGRIDPTTVFWTWIWLIFFRGVETTN